MCKLAYLSVYGQAIIHWRGFPGTSPPNETCGPIFWSAEHRTSEHEETVPYGARYPAVANSRGCGRCSGVRCWHRERERHSSKLHELWHRHRDNWLLFRLNMQDFQKINRISSGGLRWSARRICYPKAMSGDSGSWTLANLARRKRFYLDPSTQRSSPWRGSVFTVAAATAGPSGSACRWSTGATGGSTR